MSLFQHNGLSRTRESLPLYVQIKEEILDCIKSKEFRPGDRLPSEADIIEKYGVSRITAIRVLKELESDGIVYRVHGKGTFLAEREPKFCGDNIVGVVMHTTGHVFNFLSGEIINRLQEHNYYCVVLDTNKIERTRSEQDKLRFLIDRNPCFLIAEGYLKCPFEMLKSYRGKLICLHLFENDVFYPRADYVMSDYYIGGKLGAEHFTARGFERIIINSAEFYQGPRSTEELIRGVNDVFKDKGLSTDNVKVIKGHDEKGFLEVLDAAEKPAAVFCHGDSAAGAAYRYASENNLAIPADISVIGYYNTPWCGVYEPALTSISIREDEIAKSVVERILAGDARPVKKIIEPVLIKRDS